MPPLIQKWNELKDEDKDLFPLLEVSCGGGKQGIRGSTSVPRGWFCRVARGREFHSYQAVKGLRTKRVRTDLGGGAGCKHPYGICLSLVPVVRGNRPPEWLPALL